MRSTSSTSHLLFAGALASSAALLGWLGGAAVAQDGDTLSPVLTSAPAPAVPSAMRCARFTAPLSEGHTLDLPGDSEAGRWVAQQGEGWTFWSVDFEVASKPTGYPQGWVQVCLVRAG